MVLHDVAGVFPMIFLPGLSGQFIAIADTEEEAQALKPLAEACITVRGKLALEATHTAVSVSLKRSLQKN